MAEKVLQVVEQKTVEFYDDELIAVRGTDGRVYVSVRHLAEALGLDRRGQIRRIRRDAVLSDGLFMGDILSPKGRRQANWLRVDLIPLFLTGVSTNAVKDEIRAKLEKFQREAAAVLWEAFQSGRLTTTTVSFDELLQKDSPAVNAYKMALAVVELAKNQILLEARIDDHEQRLENLESTLGDTGRHITPEQAMQVSQAVKAIAMVMTKQTGSSQYGAVYGELYRRFGVTSYKQIPVNQFQDAMNFLNDWYHTLTGESF